MAARLPAHLQRLLLAGRLPWIRSIWLLCRQGASFFCPVSSLCPSSCSWSTNKCTLSAAGADLSVENRFPLVFFFSAVSFSHSALFPLCSPLIFLLCCPVLVLMHRGDCGGGILAAFRAPPAGQRSSQSHCRCRCFPAASP